MRGVRTRRRSRRTTVATSQAAASVRSSAAAKERPASRPGRTRHVTAAGAAVAIAFGVERPISSDVKRDCTATAGQTTARCTLPPPRLRQRRRPCRQLHDLCRRRAAAASRQAFAGGALQFVCEIDDDGTAGTAGDVMRLAAHAVRLERRREPDPSGIDTRRIDDDPRTRGQHLAEERPRRGDVRADDRAGRGIRAALAGPPPVSEDRQDQSTSPANTATATAASSPRVRWAVNALPDRPRAWTGPRRGVSRARVLARPRRRGSDRVRAGGNRAAASGDASR